MCVIRCQHKGKCLKLCLKKMPGPEVMAQIIVMKNNRLPDSMCRICDVKIKEKNLGEGISMIRAATTIDELIEGFAHVYGMTLEEMAEKEIEGWIENVANQAASGEFKSTGERRKVGVFDKDVLAFLKAKGIELATDEISISDRDIMHALRTAKVDPLPVSTWKRLPSLLANPLAVYWDLRKPGLVYVVEYKEIGKIIVLVGYMARVGRERIFVNTVRTGKVIKNLNEFENKKWYAVAK